MTMLNNGVVRSLMCLGAVLVGGAPLLWAADEVETVITSKRFMYETREQTAVFEEDVVVEDPRMRLRADKMWVTFGETEDVKSIKAVGRAVTVQQDDRSAGARSLTYDVKTGKLLLQENAWVRQGGNTLRGDVITIWRDDERIVAEPNVQFRVFLEGDAGGRVLSPMKP